LLRHEFYSIFFDPIKLLRRLMLLDFMSCYWIHHAYRLLFNDVSSTYRLKSFRRYFNGKTTRHSRKIPKSRSRFGNFYNKLVCLYFLKYSLIFDFKNSMGLSSHRRKYHYIQSWTRYCGRMLSNNYASIRIFRNHN